MPIMAHIAVTIPVQRTAELQEQPDQRPPCKPWCVEHLPTDLGPGTCVAEDQKPVAGEAVELTYQPDEGARISVWRESFKLISLDDAERLAHAMLVQISIARGTLTGAVS
ncbi:hypothetical protein [Nonomuraea zeae]|uniref:Uncharacterized protein n=1 Tax=Nonomuraea zeae TaxID=1642303 RepID=A0A5S4H2V8_9ACTN|nr:hypothetical protein [Nonomuraea zeae]TMR39588.1 hypothetical protein ETD85_00820 [Nonomuraea zeae]